MVRKVLPEAHALAERPLVDALDVLADMCFEYYHDDDGEGFTISWCRRCGFPCHNLEAHEQLYLLRNARPLPLSVLTGEDTSDDSFVAESGDDSNEEEEGSGSQSEASSSSEERGRRPAKVRGKGEAVPHKQPKACSKPMMLQDAAPGGAGAGAGAGRCHC